MAPSFAQLWKKPEVSLTPPSSLTSSHPRNHQVQPWKLFHFPSLLYQHSLPWSGALPPNRSPTFGQSNPFFSQTDLPKYTPDQVITVFNPSMVSDYASNQNLLIGQEWPTWPGSSPAALPLCLPALCTGVFMGFPIPWQFLKLIQLSVTGSMETFYCMFEIWIIWLYFLIIRGLIHGITE